MIEGLLIDIKGVLYENKKPIEGAKSFIHFARRKKVQIRFLTNTTVKNKSHISQKNRLKFDNYIHSKYNIYHPFNFFCLVF